MLSLLGSMPSFPNGSGEIILAGFIAWLIATARPSIEWKVGNSTGKVRFPNKPR